jgi:hypothetical protein
MKMGHCKGTKRERKGSQDWYQKHFEENLARIERELAAKQQQARQ